MFLEQGPVKKEEPFILILITFLVDLQITFLIKTIFHLNRGGILGEGSLKMFIHYGSFLIHLALAF